MKSFRDVTLQERTDDKLAYLASRVAVGDAEGLFIEAGELEQAVVDALSPARDDHGPTERALRGLSRAAAATYLATRQGQHGEDGFKAAGDALDQVARLDLPRELAVRAPEGYIHYALDPFGYALAARRYARDVGARRAKHAVVLGIRSIGTGISALVSTALGANSGFTLRPRGEQGSRAIRVTDTLLQALLTRLRDGGDVLIVDEGPGATGETFHGTAAWLRSLGVDSARIVLFPSGPYPPGPAPDEVREFFELSRRYPPPEEQSRIVRVCEQFGLDEVEDLSAGRWRAVVPGANDPPCILRHERLKFRARGPGGQRYLVRFAGLGRAGAETGLRATRLGSVGWGPEVVGAADGFLVLRWVEGGIVSEPATRTREFVDTLGRYLARRHGFLRTGRTVEMGLLVDMLRENAAEALGPDVEGLKTAICRLEALPPREATIVDGRLWRVEWIRSASGYVKTDLIDHGDGVRLPGPVDAAWDVAGAAVEYGIDPGTLREIIESCARGGRDDPKVLAGVVSAYRAPYAACQLGELSLAAREASSPAERLPLEKVVERYRTLLRREIGAPV